MLAAMGKEEERGEGKLVENEEEGESDVIVVEWASEDVQYGVTVEDRGD